MKIILRSDHESLGKAGDVLTVKDGYGRNFLIPKGIAVLATPKNVKLLEEERKLSVRREARERKDFETLAGELEKISVTASVAVGEEDKIFGSVTSQQIADLLNEKGFDVDKRKIVLAEPIKALGVYNVPIKLHSEVEAQIRLWVVKE
ncbi:MAG TPA: 50S ribosomal protein L9 [bacterium]|nr:50S ribosomal protein L9 [bacterium]